MKAVGPDQLVATTGVPQAMASMWGLPQPSPCDGITWSMEELMHRGQHGDMQQRYS